MKIEDFMKKIMLLTALFGQVCPWGNTPTSQDKMVDKIIENHDVTLAAAYVKQEEITPANQKKVNEAAQKAELIKSESSYSAKEIIWIMVGVAAAIFGIYAGKTFIDDYNDIGYGGIGSNPYIDVTTSGVVTLFSFGVGAGGFYWGFSKQDKKRAAQKLGKIAIIVNESRKK